MGAIGPGVVGNASEYLLVLACTAAAEDRRGEADNARKD